jgi:hypothetical protein
VRRKGPWVRPRTQQQVRLLLVALEGMVFDDIGQLAF